MFLTGAYLPTLRLQNMGLFEAGGGGEKYLDFFCLLKANITTKLE